MPLVFHPAVLLPLPVLSLSPSHPDTGRSRSLVVAPLCLPVALPSSLSVALACLLARTVL